MRLIDTWKVDQLRWAAEQGYSYDTKGYVGSLALNLFQPMSPDTKVEFSRGSGGELRANLRVGRPKMNALHSSSVLVCNVFDYWRHKELGPMGRALGTGSLIEQLTFEAQFPTGLPGKPPNLDVALWLRSGDVWAIESKFTEPFGYAKGGPALKDKYFPAGRPVWSDLGLIRCGALAIALQKGKQRSDTSIQPNCSSTLSDFRSTIRVSSHSSISTPIMMPRKPGNTAAR